MKAYMAYSRHCGPHEGAALVFANTAREARVIAQYSFTANEICDGDYLDLAVRLIRDQPWLLKEMRKDTPHLVDSPRSCTVCEAWVWQ